MDSFIATPKHLLRGHARYFIYSSTDHTFTFSDDLFSSTDADITGPTFTVWNLGKFTLKQILSHPDILIYTPQSHPELFI